METSLSGSSLPDVAAHRLRDRNVLPGEREAIHAILRLEKVLGHQTEIT